ncbi:hypothetical protein [Flavobacterium sp. N2820]|uniref:hypothetical protein n=1 Tax=Flavobacterium sp. N2820 TaxID=2986834 RepID=UPI00222416D8|nr:hypothetical protein [Flavobacterium sp. N2820]
MKYIAISLPEKPFIVWSSIPDGAYENPESEYFEHPLVLDEEDVPSTEFGVCPLKIVEGALVSRTPAEMTAFESQWIQSEFLRNNKLIINQVNEGSFTYDTQTFPMDERSRIFYQAFDRARGTVGVKCMTTAGALYTLPVENIDAFMDAYFSQLRELSKPLV